MKQLNDELEGKLYPKLPKEFKETANKVLQENSTHNAESIIEKITNRRQKLTAKYTEISYEINRLKAINLALDVEMRELSENGHTHVNSQRMRDIFVVIMNNQCSIGMDGLYSIETLECELEHLANEIKNIDSQLASLITLPQQNQHPDATPPENTQQQREQVLIELLSELKAKQPDLNFQLLPYDKETMFQMLKNKNPVLFTDGVLEDFWKNKSKGICKLKRGKKSE